LGYTGGIFSERAFRHCYCFASIFFLFFVDFLPIYGIISRKGVIYSIAHCFLSGTSSIPKKGDVIDHMQALQLEDRKETEGRLYAVSQMPAGILEGCRGESGSQSGCGTHEC
jgi:hypothetical protein